MDGMRKYEREEQRRINKSGVVTRTVVMGDFNLAFRPNITGFTGDNIVPQANFGNALFLYFVQEWLVGMGLAAITTFSDHPPGLNPYSMPPAAPTRVGKKGRAHEAATLDYIFRSSGEGGVGRHPHPTLLSSDHLPVVCNMEARHIPPRTSTLLQI